MASGSSIRHNDRHAPWQLVHYSNILELVWRSCGTSPDTPAIIFEDGVELTRAALLERVERFAAYLSTRIRPQDRVAIMLPNRAEFMISWLAVVACRGILVSINTGAQEHDAREILSDSGATLAIVDGATAPLVRRLRPDCPRLEDILVVGPSEPDGLAVYESPGASFHLSDARPSREDITNIYYTSGTTGVAKGCMLDHEWWLRYVDIYLRLYGLDSDDRLLCCLQFYYGDPPWMLLASLHAGTSLVTMRKFSVSRFWQVVRKHRVTQLFTIASIANLLLKAVPTQIDHDNSVKFALHFGIPASLHKSLVERWKFPWIEAYGLTETGLVISVPREAADRLVGSGSIGVPCPDVNVRIVDEQGSDVAVGDPGEILIKGPGLMRGYLNRPDATRESMRDGWFHTGDIGRTDTDGLFYFLRRKKDIIRRGGENIAAAEVEQVLRSHPMILDAAVIPVADDLRGEEVKAYVQLLPGESSESLPPEEIAEYCGRKLARYKIPRYIEYRTTDFPRTPSMRVRKELLRLEKDDPTSGVWDRELTGTNRSANP
jgi:crotonobetaine/carnitine-CoA ligase